MQEHPFGNTASANAGIIEWTNSVAKPFAEIDPPQLPHEEQLDNFYCPTQCYQEPSDSVLLASRMPTFGVPRYNTFHTSNDHPIQCTSGTSECSYFISQRPTLTAPRTLLPEPDSALLSSTLHAKRCPPQYGDRAQSLQQDSQTLLYAPTSDSLSPRQSQPQSFYENNTLPYGHNGVLQYP